ncbi:Translation machinery-associated protein 46 [Elasticomyces elasticus]|nr:Translation machinery-associated protein 46 [Elasticomyces elasticus]
MPPKKQDPGPKKVKASAADKTFGMKNKKGGAAQKQIKQIQQATAAAKTPEEKKKAAEKEAREKEKDAAERARAEAAELFKPVNTQKVPFGVDPKTVLCQFFKKGLCDKGRKCKFSHDLDLERKTMKRSLYTDTREGDEEEGKEGEGAEKKKEDDMADWDEEKLRGVVMSKHGNPKTTTDKVCKFFIEAVENQKYGWNWSCPNGGDKCMYKHSLPPGFVLKTKEQRAAEKALMDKSPLATLTLEDFLESERHKLTGTLTPVTPETFAKWKQERLDKKAAEAEAQKMKEATGRAMFEKGGWEESGDEDSDSDDDGGAWNLEAMRKETEAARQRREEERLGLQNGGEMPQVAEEPNGNVGDDDSDATKYNTEMSKPIKRSRRREASLIIEQGEAAAEVLGLPELLETILLEIDTKTILLSQRVNKKFRDVIARSKKLQIELGFQAPAQKSGKGASSQRSTTSSLLLYEPINMGRYHFTVMVGFIGLWSEESGEDFCDGQITFVKNTRRGSPSTRICSGNAANYEHASWRRMLVIAGLDDVHFQCVGEVGNKSCADLDFEAENVSAGVSTGEVHNRCGKVVLPRMGLEACKVFCEDEDEGDEEDEEDEDGEEDEEDEEDE